MRNGLKKVMALVLTLMMILSLVPATVFAETTDSNTVVVKAPVAPQSEGDEQETYSIVINYVFENGEQVANPWTATIAKGSSYAANIQSPTVVGYTADQTVVNVNVTNIQKDEAYTVTYRPALVNFTVKHYLQNVDDDKYTLANTETKQGYTEAAVGDALKNTTDYDGHGFTALLYDTTTKIAADGSTVVEIYYDRNYYLLSLDLDGGYGADPVYARFGAPVSVDDPTKPGYTFTGWEPAVPSTMPAENQKLKAQWTQNDAVNYTVVFWYENADDTDYSYAGSVTQSAPAGTTISSGNFQNTDFTGRDAAHFTYNSAKTETATVAGDGSTVVNVYFTRNTYTLKFRELDCDKWLFHSHDDSCYKVVKTITAKYQNDIHGNFPIKDGSKTIWWEVPSNCESFVPGNYLGSIDTMPGENITFTKYESETGAKIYYYVETLNGAAGDTSYNSKNYKQYKVIDLEYSTDTNLTYAEEFHPITGFTQGDSDPYLPKDGKVRMKENNYLYYTRNSYSLKFYNYNGYVTGKGGSVQYEAPLKDYNFDPSYPAGLEANAYEFVGWYTTPGCFEGSEVNWDTMTMPASDVVLYAKWAPKTHTVKTYLTKDDVPDGTPLDTWANVAHRSTITKPDNPENGNYDFVGWFYEENGVEKAFDFSMAITKDLNLYAKWSSNKLVEYTIKYELEDGTEIAPPTNGSALAGSTKTFDAKAGEQLNEGYRSGYFPETNSHSMTMDIEGNNEYTFIYVLMEKVKYTVRYLDKATGEPVVVNGVPTPDKNAETSNAVITETFKQITGYAPDAYQKRLVLSASEEENVLIFWYVKDDVHAPVQIIHWTQNIAGDGYTEYQSSTKLDGVIGQTYTEASLTIPGYTYNAGKSNPSGKLTADGLVLNLYYDRIEYPYEFRFLEQGTDKVLAVPVTGNARYQAQVTQTAKDIPGYTLVGAGNQAMTIAIEDPANVASKNVRIFYYTENTVNITYVAVQPADAGNTLSSYADPNVKAVTGTVGGSTPNPNAPTYKFVGWFKDEACTIHVDPSWVDKDNKLIPQKEKIGTDEKNNDVMGYKAATYYAKFDLDVTTITVHKKVEGNFADKSANYRFVMTFIAEEGKDFSNVRLNDSATTLGTGKTLTFELGDNGNATIANVPIGAKINFEEQFATDKGYTVTINNVATDKVENYVVGVNPHFEVVNTKNTTPDTGVSLDALPYILIIACVAAIGAFVIIRRRKDRED